MKHRYLVALGSNVPHHRHGRPEGVIAAALAELDGKGLKVKAVSPIVRTPPVGPSLRQFANAAAIVKSKLEPDDLLDRLKAIEGQFGRKGRGRRWAARVLDLDIVLWDGGMFAADGLVVPHPRFRTRDFVLAPARAIAGHWRDPVSGLTVRQLYARLTRPRSPPN